MSCTAVHRAKEARTQLRCLGWGSTSRSISHKDAVGLPGLARVGPRLPIRAGFLLLRRCPLGCQPALAAMEMVD